MNDKSKPEPNPPARRRFLGVLGALGAAGLISPLLRGRQIPRELDLKEAEFYRPHDLAG
jgi:hypothetical protein